jgi:hypothetical protein
MKKLFAGFVAMIATLNLFAQESQQDAAVQKTQQEGLTLKDKTVWIIENGERKVLSEEIWMRNGMQITPAGTLIFANGEKAKLREGDFVDMKGAVARPIPIGTEVATK